MKLFIYSLLGCLVLIVNGCGSPELPPVKMTLLDFNKQKEIKQLKAQQTMQSVIIQETLVDPMAALERIQASRSDIDPLTNYIDQYKNDKTMQSYVEKVRIEKAKRCARVEGFYQRLDKKLVNLADLARNYSYSCPHVVAKFIDEQESREYEMDFIQE